MKRTLFELLGSLAILSLTGCSLSLLGTPTALQTPLVMASPTLLSETPTPAASATPAVPSDTPTVSLPTVTPGPAEATATTGLVPTTTTGGILAGNPSGPYGVIQIVPDDVLIIRSAPGAGNPVTGSFAANTTTVMRTGPASTVGEDLWVQVQKSGSDTGWVNAAYLTEYVTPAAFCADGRVNSLLTNFGNALKTSDGQALAALVSQAHGMTVRLWRNGNAVPFFPKDARWIFESTYEHNWGAAPGSGLDTIGSIHEVVIPEWLDVLNVPTPGYISSCDAPQSGGASYDTSWPASYANINFYSLFKPGPAGNEYSWRTLLIGVEYVQGQPYIFSVTQMDWEP